MLHPRARTMLLLAPPALIIGVASSLILIVIMKVAAVLQSVLWTSLPSTVGLSASSPTWVILILTLTGIAVGLVIRYSPGRAGSGDRAADWRASRYGRPARADHRPDYRPGGGRQPRARASGDGGEYRPRRCRGVAYIAPG